jgi:hypothetical protein
MEEEVMGGLINCWLPFVLSPGLEGKWQGTSEPASTGISASRTCLYRTCLEYSTIKLGSNTCFSQLTTWAWGPFVPCSIVHDRYMVNPLSVWKHSMIVEGKKNLNPSGPGNPWIPIRIYYRNRELNFWHPGLPWWSSFMNIDKWTKCQKFVRRDWRGAKNVTKAFLEAAAFVASS